MHRKRTSAHPPLSILYSLFSLLFLIPGCIRYGATLNLSTINDNRKLLADFSQAYIDRDDAGDYVVVLVHDPIDQVKPGSADKPIDPATVPPLRQILTIRVLWRPMKGAKFDHPVATNASLHWYVFDRTAQSTGFLHYAGNAFVDVYPDRDRASLAIRNAAIKVIEKSGDMADPIGPARLKGSFDCLEDETRVANFLAEVKERTAVMASAPAPVPLPTEMPPPRLPATP